MAAHEYDKWNNAFRCFWRWGIAKVAAFGDSVGGASVIIRLTYGRPELVSQLMTMGLPSVVPGIFEANVETIRAHRGDDVRFVEDHRPADLVAGFFNARHRADADVAAPVALLTTMLPTGRTVCSEMILSAQRSTIQVTADGASFETNDRLKGRGYRWNQHIRRWWKEVASTALENERMWLAEHAPAIIRPSAT
jgi:hypothetical protein